MQCFGMGRNPLLTLSAILFPLIFSLAGCGGSSGGGNNADNQTPAFTSATAGTGYFGQTATNYRASATDADGDAIVFAISGGPDRRLFSIDADTGQLSFKLTPTFVGPLADPEDVNGDGIYEIAISAQDQEGAIAYLELDLELLRQTQTVVYLDEDLQTLYATEDDNSIAPVAASNTALTAITEFQVAPDKSKVAYIADADTSGVDELYVHDLGTNASTKVSQLQDAESDVTGFAWSPDSDRLLYRADGGLGTATSDSNDSTSFVDGDFRLYVVDADGENFSIVSVATDFSNDNKTVSEQFAWSPSGEHAVYSIADSSVSVAYGQELYLHDMANPAETSSLIFSVAAGKRIQDPHWSPDGAYAAFHTDRFKTDLQYEIWGYHMTTADAVRLNGNLDTTVADEAAYIASVIWSEGGSYLAQEVIGFTSNNSSLQAVDISLVTDPGNISSVRISAPSADHTSSQFSGFEWSTAGALLAFADDHLTESVRELFVFGAASYFQSSDSADEFLSKINQELILDQDVQAFSWSPDSGSLLYALNTTEDTDVADASSTEEPEPGSGVFLRDRLASADPVELWPASAEADIGTMLAWAENSERVAFLTISNDLATWYISDLEATLLTASEPVPTADAEQTPQWSSDSILLATINTTGIYTYSVMETVERLLTASIPHGGTIFEYAD